MEGHVVSEPVRDCVYRLGSILLYTPAKGCCVDERTGSHERELLPHPLYPGVRPGQYRLVIRAQEVTPLRAFPATPIGLCLTTPCPPHPSLSTAFIRAVRPSPEARHSLPTGDTPTVCSRFYTAVDTTSPYRVLPRQAW